MWTILSRSHAYVHSMWCVCVWVCVSVCVRGEGERGNSWIAVHILLRDPLSKSTWLASLEALTTIFSLFPLALLYQQLSFSKLAFSLLSVIFFFFLSLSLSTWIFFDWLFTFRSLSQTWAPKCIYFPSSVWLVGIKCRSSNSSGPRSKKQFEIILSEVLFPYHISSKKPYLSNERWITVLCYKTTELLLFM